VEGDALLGEGTVGDLGDVVVLDGEDAIEHLDHGDLRAERVVEVGELHADRPRADDEHALGLGLQVHRVGGVDDRLAVAGGEGQLLRSGAGADEDLVGGDRLGHVAAGPGVVVAGGRADFKAAGAGGRRAGHDLRVTLDVIDLVLLEEEGDAVVERARDLPAAADHLVPVDGDVLRLDAPLLTVGDRLGVQLGIVEQRLRGDAPPVQADAAELVALDACRLHAELRAANGADVAGGAAANDDKVVVLRVRHPCAP
jgi:hypothetical protein